MADVATITLTSFLLARLKEDRASLWCGSRFHDSAASSTYPDCWRAAADCDFREKREMVAKWEAFELHSGWHVCPTGDGVGCTDYGDGSGEDWEALCPTLLAIAAVYADHPDYRSEWRA